jgi:HlyD family secretion protein
MNRSSIAFTMAVLGVAVGCRRADPATRPRATGYVEATEVKVASKVPGRVETVRAIEGARVAAGDVVVTLATTDADLALDRVRAERAQADAQLRLLLAGSRAEDVQQAEAQVTVAAADAKAAEAEVTAARTDEARFQQLLDKRAGSQKQRDDATARRELAEARLKAANDRAAAAAAVVSRVKAGARPQEIDAARGRVAAIDAQIATIQHDRAEASIVAPVSGVVTSRLVEPGELVGAAAPVAVIVDLDHAWVNAYVEEPFVPQLTLGATVTVVTDGGQRLKGRIAFISPRAEFTPRNVQTSAERAKLVYRVKVDVDNREGVLKPGMPVEVELVEK